MSIDLTEDIREALAANPEEPLHLIDHKTNAAYVLLPAAVYDRLKGRLEDDEDQALQQAWLDLATKTRRAWVQENPY
jgi:hypothetical protein